MMTGSPESDPIDLLAADSSIAAQYSDISSASTAIRSMTPPPFAPELSPRVVATAPAAIPDSGKVPLLSLLKSPRSAGGVTRESCTPRARQK